MSYSKKELERFFHNSGFKTVQVYRKDKGLVLKAQKYETIVAERSG